MSVQQRAEDILRVIAGGRRRRDLTQATADAHDHFVDGETDAELRQLAEVLLMARRQANLQNLLDDDREALHHEALSHEEHISIGQHYEMLRHQACTYNHMLRDFIEAWRHDFTRAELMEWLSRASFGREDWARGEITGALSEIALHAALQGLPQLRDVRYGTIEEDLAGYDLVTTWHGKMLTFDAKTGRYAPLAEMKHGHEHIEISVPREAVKDLRLERRGLTQLRRHIQLALLESVPPHTPHPHPRPVVV